MIQAEEAETFVGRVLSASRDQRQVEAQEELRKTKLKETIGELDLPRDEGEAFQSFLMRYHHAFSLEDGACTQAARNEQNPHRDAFYTSP